MNAVVQFFCNLVCFGTVVNYMDARLQVPLFFWNSNSCIRIQFVHC